MDTQTTLQDDEVNEAPESLRDILTAEVEEVEAQATKDQEAPEGVQADAVIGETKEQTAERQGRTAGRQRDEKGRLMPGKAQEAAPVETQQAAPVAPEKPAISRPSTWKKEHWQDFDKLAAENPALAQYVLQRESEFAKGVSTYKQEAERATKLWGALEPFIPDLQRNNIAPEQWISNLGRAHQTLALGSPQQKLQMFQRLAQDYGVPLQAMLQGQDGQQQIDPILQYINPIYEQVRQLQGQLRSHQSQQEQAQQKQLESEIARFSEGKEHFETVKETMAGLLQSGLAQDLESAYQAAIRMPQHDSIFQAMQQQQREADEKRRIEEQRANTVRARQQTVSTRSGTPTAAKAKTNGSGLRDVLSEAFESHTSGRV